MQDINQFCVSCFQYSLNENGVCSQCGFDLRRAGEGIPVHQLPMRTVLGGKYLVGRVLGEGGFGVTYEGWDINLEVKVAIKEYYPSGFAVRNTQASNTVTAMTGSAGSVFFEGRDRFIQEAKRLAKFFTLPGVVAVRDYFQENETAYIVMEFIEGYTLKEHLEQCGGRLPWEEALQLFRPVIQSLIEVHRFGIIHRDISPDNLMFLRSGQLCLIDFGAARDYTDMNKSLSVMLKPGYAPEEQYRSKGVQGPWTDVYALCATLYRAIEGEKPPEALERMIDDTLTGFTVPVPPAVAQALLKGLSPRQNQRYQNMEELFADLYEKPIPQPAPPPPAPEPVPVAVPAAPPLPEKPRSRMGLVAVMVAVALLGTVLGLSTLWSTKSPQSAVSKAAAASAVSPSQKAAASTPSPQETLGPVVQVCTGNAHTLAIDQKGVLWAWGDNGVGQLGDGTKESRLYPVPVLEDVQQVSAGEYHTLAVKTDGTLWAWGYNWQGQLGTGDKEYQSAPVQIMEDVQQVSAGAYHSLVLKTDGSLWSFGDNEFGKLGPRGNDDVTQPEKVLDGIIQAAAGEHNSLAVKTDGTLWIWGSNRERQLGEEKGDGGAQPIRILEDVQWAEAGGYGVVGHLEKFLALKADGTLWGWGGNYSLRSSSSTLPEKILDGVRSAAVGAQFILVVKQDGSLWGWGDNEQGQLGNGSVAAQWEPMQILEGVQQVAAGPKHALAVKEDGSLWAWGWNDEGQLGNGVTANTARPAQIMEEVQWAFAGDHHSLAVKTDGSLWGWGRNDHGQVTRTQGQWHTGPVSVLDGVQAAAQGDLHTVALGENGNALVWGYGVYDEENQNTKGVLQDVVQVAASSRNTLLLQEDGSLWLYPDIGSREGIQPEKIREDVKQVALAYNQILAVQTDGSLWSWDLNSPGQTPQQIMADVDQVALSYTHAAVIKTDGSLWLWGDPVEQADGSYVARETPKKILDGVQQVSLRGGFTLALKTDGTLWSWGANQYGQLGSGTLQSSVVPEKILEDVRQVSSGLSYALAVKKDGTLWAWGYNGEGQLGDNADAFVMTPQQISQ